MRLSGQRYRPRLGESDAEAGENHEINVERDALNALDVKRRQAALTSSRARTGEATDDLAGVPPAIRHPLGTSDDAGPVSRLDRVALTGQLGKLELLDVFPVRPFDRDRVPAHGTHNPTKRRYRNEPLALTIPA
jgi:hypothetical protein